jgi:hypothetical protein
MSIVTAWFPGPSAEPSLSDRRRNRTRNLAGGAISGHPGPLAHGRLASLTTAGQLRRNAVGALGVKLVAAPDAPPWGEVLACLPPVPSRIQRRTVAATDIHPTPHCHARQARTVRGGTGCETVRIRPAVWADRRTSAWVPVLAQVLVTGTQAANGGPRAAAGQSRIPVTCGAVRGWRIAQQLARPIGRSVTAGGRDRICGRDPRPGKDPS